VPCTIAQAELFRRHETVGPAKHGMINFLGSIGPSNMHVTTYVRSAIGAAVAASFIAGAAAAMAGGARAQEPQDHSADAFRRVCSTCHDAQRILATRRTRTQWEEVIGKMIERGAQGTEEDFAAAQEYLMRVSGRVNVNRVAAADLVTVLGITEKEATAIIDYRKAKGDFADFEALCKVPGLDVEKLKTLQDAISY
jgi:competence protein ComEA